MALATSAETDIAKLAEVADKVFFASQQSSVSALQPVGQTSDLSKQDNATEPEVNSAAGIFICQFHRTFGMKARKCSDGCTFAALITKRKNDATAANRESNTTRAENAAADRT